MTNGLSGAGVGVTATGPLHDVADLQRRLGVNADGIFGPASRAALLARLTNRNAPAMTDADIAAYAARWNVPVGHVRGVRKVEAPKGAFDAEGRPTSLYEKHVFGRNSGHRFDASHPVLSSRHWQPGTYGPASIQYDKLAQACALDPEAAFKACSFGAFQVLGENAIAIGYPSAFDMACDLAGSEVAHLESFSRFIETNRLVAKLRACVPGNPKSCVPFVEAYNGEGYAANHYDVKFAEAIR